MYAAIVIQQTDADCNNAAASSCVIRLSVINLPPLTSYLIEMPPPRQEVFSLDATM